MIQSVVVQSGGGVRVWSGRALSAGAVLLCMCWFPAALTASVPEEESVISLDSAVHRAVAWHPSIVEAAARLGARVEEIDAAEAGYRPRISAGIGSNYDSVTASRWRPRANISASQMLYDFGKVSSSVAFAEAGVGIGEAQLLLAVDSLIRDTSYSVIEIQRTLALRDVALDQLESVRSISQLVFHRYERGAATRSDALQAEARVQAAEAMLDEIEAEHQRWESNLAHLLGRETAPPVSPQVPERFMQSCEQGEPNWARIPAIMQVRAERDRALADLDRSKADALPTVSLGAGGSTDIHDPLSRRADYNFGINISSSIYNGGASSARTRGAAHELAAARAAEERIRNDVSRLLLEAQRQVASFSRILRTLGDREQSMRETGKLYRLQYLEMGTRTLVDLLNAEQELHQVRFDRASMEHDLRRLQVDCLFNSGTERDAFGLSGTVIGGTVL